MSYDLIKAGMKGIIEALALAPSESTVDFETASANEYGNTYILFSSQGDLEGNESETLVDRVYDTQEWIINVAFSKGTHSSLINLDELNRKREELIKNIDNPTNWTSFARMLNVTEWKVEEFEHYFVLYIKVKITDTITY